MARSQSKKRRRFGFAKPPHSTNSVPSQSQGASHASAGVPSVSGTSGILYRLKRFFRRQNQLQPGLIGKETPGTSTGARTLEQREQTQAPLSREMATDNPGLASIRATTSRDVDIVPRNVPVSCRGKLTPVNLVASVNTAFTGVQHAPDAYLQPLKTFNVVATTIENVHPYAELALRVLIIASQCIVNQATFDDMVSGLLSTVSKVYEFLIEDDTIEGIESMRETLGMIARVVSDATRFIINRPGRENFWNRIRKKTREETEIVVGGYIKLMNDLMQQYRDRTVQDLGINTYPVLKDRRLGGMPYAGGAGPAMTKICLDGTRTEILRETINWIISPDPNSPRILWLHGQAGRGKSAVAHTIGLWMQNVGGLGTLFCFSRDRQAEQREGKILTTIARDLADRNPAFRRALADVVGKNHYLKTTADMMRQWNRLILEPLSKIDAQIVGNMVVVIDALDESGDEMSRVHILSLLASTEAAHLPANFRILLTSRALPDIERALRAAPHVRVASLDGIPLDSVEHDIGLYVSKELDRLPGIRATEVHNIVKESNGLFAWARLACKFIKSNEVGKTPKECYDDLVALESGVGRTLLDGTYFAILKSSVPQSGKGLEHYRSVMRQLVMALEPLPMVALSRMCEKFLNNYEVTLALGFMSSVLVGVVDRSTPIQPLHPSFYDFLTDPARSGVYFINTSDTKDMAFATLQILYDELQFNICGLESSYLANADVLDLSERIKRNILPHLSYSCQFWARHLEKTTFDLTLAAMVKAIIGSEKFIFWLEIISLLGVVGKGVDTLSSIATWLLGQDGFEDVLELVEDGIKFIQNFGNVMLHSTPHLYLSALAFIPPNTSLSTMLMPKFQCLARVVVGGLSGWPALQLSLKGHTSEVSSVAFSPDGKSVASGSLDRTVRIWDVEGGVQIGSPFKGYTSEVNSVAFSPNGRRITSGSRDITVRLWDVESHIQIGSFLEGHTSFINSVAFSPDGKRIVSGSFDGTVRVWDVERGVQIGKPLQHISAVKSVAFSPDGRRIASGSVMNDVIVWDVEKGVQIGSPLEGHNSGVRSVAFSPSGERIVSGSQDHTVRIWDVERGLQIGRPFDHGIEVNSVAFSPDGKRVLSGGGRNVRVWDVERGVEIGCPLDGHIVVKSAAFSPDGKKIVSGSWDSTVRVWDIERGMQVGGPLNHTSQVNSVAFSPDGKKIVSGSADKTVRVWDAEGGVQVGSPLQGHTSFVNSVALSPDGRRVVSGSSDMTVRVWDIERCMQIGSPLEGHTTKAYSVAFFPDGKRIVSGGDGTVRVWDVERGVLIGRPLEGHSSRVYSVASSPNGTMIVSGSMDKTLRVWDVAGGVQIGSPLQGHTSFVTSVAFFPDGKRIVSGSLDNTVRVWDVEQGVQISSPLQHRAAVRSIALSPCGKKIISGSADKTVRVWDIEGVVQIGSPLQGHTSSVTSVAFSPDGKRIVSGSLDKTVRVWDVKRGVEIGSPLQEHISYLNSVAFFPNEERITSGSNDQNVTVCDALSNGDKVSRHRKLKMKAAGSVPTSCHMGDFATGYHICFSPVLSHALHNSEQLVYGFMQEEANMWVEPVKLQHDGWIRGPKGRLLLWIPISLRIPFYSIWNTVVIPRGCCVELDLSLMVHGQEWYKCFKEAV